MVIEPIKVPSTILLTHIPFLECVILPAKKAAKTNPVTNPKLGFIMDCIPPENPAKIGKPISPKNM